MENKSNLSSVCCAPEIILHAGGTAVIKSDGDPCCHELRVWWPLTNQTLGRAAAEAGFGAV